MKLPCFAHRYGCKNFKSVKKTVSYPLVRPVDSNQPFKKQKRIHWWVRCSYWKSEAVFDQQGDMDCPHYEKDVLK